MKRILIFIFAALAFAATGQNNLVKNAMVAYSNGAPTWAPGSFKANEISIDTLTGAWYEWKWTTNYTQGSWIASGYRIQTIAGCSAPLYMPGKLQSRLVINGCPTPELYYYTGAAWVQVGGAAYSGGYGIDISSTVISADTSEVATPSYVRSVVRDSAYSISGGTGISISGSQTKVITNTSPDQTVSITGGGINTVTGTYPNFTVTGTEVDGSTTNEIELPSQTGNNGKYLTTNGSAPSWATVSAGVSGAGLTNRLAYWTGSGALGYESSIRIDSVNNRLGIGISPSNPLHIYGPGGSNVSQFVIENAETNAFSITSYNDDYVGFGLSTKWNGGQWIATDNSAALFYKYPDYFSIAVDEGLTKGLSYIPTVRMVIKNNGQVGIGTASPNASAKLDITSTTGGLLLPRMTTAQRDAISTPADGLYVYNSTIGNFNVYQGSSWRHVVTGEGTLTGTRAALVGGTNNTASGLYSAVIGGDGCKATAQAAVAQAGTGAEATATSSFATGSYAWTYLSGQVSMSTGTMDGPGTNQASIYSLYKQNTGTSTYELTSPTRAVLNTSINNNRVWNVRVQCVASVIVVGNGTCAVGDVYSCVYQVTAKRQSNTLTLVGTPEALATPVSDANMSTASFTISADNTNKALKVEFTPPTTAGSTTQIRAIATLYITELAWN